MNIGDGEMGRGGLEGKGPGGRGWGGGGRRTLRERMRGSRWGRARCLPSVSDAACLAEAEAVLVGPFVGAHLQPDDGLALAELVLAEVARVVLGFLHPQGWPREPLGLRLGTTAQRVDMYYMESQADRWSEVGRLVRR